MKKKGWMRPKAPYPVLDRMTPYRPESFFQIWFNSIGLDSIAVSSGQESARTLDKSAYDGKDKIRVMETTNHVSNSISTPTINHPNLVQDVPKKAYLSDHLEGASHHGREQIERTQRGSCD